MSREGVAMAVGEGHGWWSWPTACRTCSNGRGTELTEFTPGVGRRGAQRLEGGPLT